MVMVEVFLARMMLLTLNNILTRYMIKLRSHIPLSFCFGWEAMNTQCRQLQIVFCLLQIFKRTLIHYVMSNKNMGLIKANFDIPVWSQTPTYNISVGCYRQTPGERPFIFLHVHYSTSDCLLLHSGYVGGQIALLICSHPRLTCFTLKITLS